MEPYARDRILWAVMEMLQDAEAILADADAHLEDIEIIGPKLLIANLALQIEEAQEQLARFLIEVTT